MSETAVAYKLHVISHTHWDREWYLSFENFRLLLVDLIDHLLDIMEGDDQFRYFHLDGQTIVLEDYLEIRPQNRERLAKLISEGRVLIGPWYLQNDEYLTNGESTVRNLLIGYDICRRQFGVEPMKVGYLPDQFGNISQMPQILRGFGIDNAVYGRGYTGPEGRPEFLWRAPDGSEVFALHLFQWYNNAQRLPRDPQRAIAMCRELIARQSERIGSEHVVLMNGVDHLEAQENLADIIRETNAATEEFQIVHDTLPNVIEEIRAAVPGLKSYTGEMRVGDEGNVLSGTASSRVYLKQYNRRCEQTLQRYAEPLAVIARLLGATYRYEDPLNYALKLLVQCHPHDSICGCSIDEVHFQMEARFRRVLDVLDDQVRRSMFFISAGVETGAASHHSVLTVFNPQPLPRTQVVELPVDVLATESMDDYEIVDAAGARVEFAVIDSRQVMAQVLNPKRLPKILRICRSRVVMELRDLPALGYKALFLRPKKKARRRMAEEAEASEVSMFAAAGQGVVAKQAEEPAVAGRPLPKKRKRPIARYKGQQIAQANVVLENDYLAAKFNANGTFDLTLKPNGRVFAGCHYFEDIGDRGNEYIYMRPKNDSERTTEYLDAQLEVLEKSTLRQRVKVTYKWKLPKELEDATESRPGKQVEVCICSTITLARGSRCVDIETCLKNTVKDHRLRVMFPTRVHADEYYADAPFDLVKRPYEMGIPNRNNQHPMESFFTATDSRAGLAVFSDGMPEHEVLPRDSTMALTLLRCVDLLGDLPPTFWEREQLLKDYTPDAQCLREFTFRYAVYPYTGQIAGANLKAESEKFLLQPIAYQLATERDAWLGVRPGAPEYFNYFEDDASRIPEPGKVQPAQRSLFQIDNPNVWLSAVKWAEDGSGSCVLRLVNLLDEEQRVKCYSDFKIRDAEELRLDETAVGNITVVDEGICITLGARKVLTIKMNLITS